MKKIAILRSWDDRLTFELADFSEACLRQGIEVKQFHENEPILAYEPDCVLVTSPQQAKLTPFPTYGLINLPRDEYLGLPRFLRNTLTYDGYLTFSPRLRIMLKDLLFGARKLGAQILNFDLFSPTKPFMEHKSHIDLTQYIIFEPNFTTSRFKSAIYHLLDNLPVRVVTFSVNGVNRHHSRFIAISHLDELDNIIAKTPIVISLQGGDEQEQYISSTTIKLIMSSAFTITHATKDLKDYFGESLLTIDAKDSLKDLLSMISQHASVIRTNVNAAIDRAKAAHEIARKTFSLDQLLTNFIELHQQTLIAKGYAIHPDPKVESQLPSVSYIMRTGGKYRPHLERALNCLVAQQYPDLRVIFVTHVKVPFIDEIIKQYPSIKFKVLERFKSRRSEAIRDGMAAVETDLFGLFDDDDELFPNHVRSLVKTMQYHSNRDWRGEIGMVYSGSIHADDTHPVYERVEFQDEKLGGLKEKRAIEHFRYYSSALMSQHAWFMPNGWLARKSLIDNELLDDPALDTCEDLYFELQIAQRRQMAFSVEVTAIHHFHHLGNSTMDDSHKHLPDTQRIALRNFSRTFPMDAHYDTGYNIVGRQTAHDPNQIAYQDFLSVEGFKDNINQFYPFRNQQADGLSGSITVQPLGGQVNTAVWILMRPFKLIFATYRFVTMNKYKRGFYLNKFTYSLRRYGVKATIMHSIHFLSGERKVDLFTLPKKTDSNASLFFAKVKLWISIFTRFMRLAIGVKN